MLVFLGRKVTSLGSNTIRQQKGTWQRKRLHAYCMSEAHMTDNCGRPGSWEQQEGEGEFCLPALWKMTAGLQAAKRDRGRRWEMGLGRRGEGWTHIWGTGLKKAKAKTQVEENYHLHWEMPPLERKIQEGGDRPPLVCFFHTQGAQQNFVKWKNATLGLFDSDIKSKQRGFQNLHSKPGLADACLNETGY